MDKLDELKDFVKKKREDLNTLKDERNLFVNGADFVFQLVLEEIERIKKQQ